MASAKPGAVQTDSRNFEESLITLCPVCKASVAARLLLRPGIFLAVYALPAFRPLQGASCSPVLHHAFSKLRVHQRVAPIIHGLRSESGGPRPPRCSRTSRCALSPSPCTYSLHAPGDSLASLMNRGKTNRTRPCGCARRPAGRLDGQRARQGPRLGQTRRWKPLAGEGAPTQPISSRVPIASPVPVAPGECRCGLRPASVTLPFGAMLPIGASKEPLAALRTTCSCSLYSPGGPAGGREVRRECGPQEPIRIYAKDRVCGFGFVRPGWGACSNFQPLAVPIAAGPWTFSTSEASYHAAKFGTPTGHPARHRRSPDGEGRGGHRPHTGARHRPRLERAACRRHAMGAADETRGQRGRERHGAGYDRRPAHPSRCPRAVPGGAPGRSLTATRAGTSPRYLLRLPRRLDRCSALRQGGHLTAVSPRTTYSTHYAS